MSGSGFAGGVWSLLGWWWQLHAWAAEQLFSLMSLTFTLTVHMPTLVTAAVLLLFLGFYVMRYHVLARYSRLPAKESAPDAAVKASALRPERQQEPQAKQFLPEEIYANFLQSIRLFNYLERHVVREIAKEAVQVRMERGEIIWRSNRLERDLYLVVDGRVQVFLASQAATSSDLDSSPSANNSSGILNEDGNTPSLEGFREAHLLNEVHSGGLVSSAFDILSIYTENITLDENNGFVGPSELARINEVDKEDPSAESVAENDGGTSAEGRLRSVSNASVDVPVRPSSKPASRRNSSRMPPRGATPVAAGSSAQKDRAEYRKHTDTAGTSQTIVARAAVDSTLLVIPEETFRKLTIKYPRAASHIVQIILTRFQRVTFLTLYKYLGLTSELLKIEQSVNDFSGYGLPENLVLSRMDLDRLRDLPKRKLYGAEMENNSLDSLGTLPSPYLQRKKIRKITDHGAFLVSEDAATTSRKPFRRTDHVRSESVTAEMMNHLHGENSDMSRNEIRQLIFECVAKSIGLPLGGTTSCPAIQLGSVSASPMKLDDSMPSVAPSPLRTGTPVMEPTSAQPSQSSQDSIVTDVTDVETELQILYFEQGSTLVKQGERNAGLFFLVDGILDVYVRDESKQQANEAKRSASGRLGPTSILDLAGMVEQNEGPQEKIFTIRPGGLAGYLAALTGHPSFVTIRAKTDVYVGFLPKSSMDHIAEKYPTVLLTLAKRLVTKVSPLVVHIDFALEWLQINAGKVLFRQDDPTSDSIYIVLNGRLRSIEERKRGQPEVIDEFGQGESVGELDVLTNTSRTSTVHAIRDTELAQMPKTLFNALALRHPEITIQISRIIAARSRSLITRISDQGTSNLNLKTVALLPTSPDVPLTEFAERLREAFAGIGTTSTVLGNATVTYVLGRHAFSRLAKLKLMSWLTEQEEAVRLVLYVADSAANSNWTQWCIRQADCILLVAIANEDSKQGEYERLMLSSKSTARKELVLLHNQRHMQPGCTSAWLRSRPWIQAHHHIQMAMRDTQAGSTKRNNPLEDLKYQFERITRLYSRMGHQRKNFAPKHHGNRSDFARLARRLTGRTIGVALGGGGARGIAHIGVLQAFEEAGIPIDVVGGVSIGALIGGLFSRNEDIWYTYWRVKDFSARFVSVWRKVLDLTYPLTSWFTGKEFNRSIWKCFGDHLLEDSWINYFCLTTNITHSKMEIHTSGYTWRYVRASMSLSGYLPPLCDNGNMLLDGGYLNNLPGDVLRSRGADTVIAIDVGSEEDTSPIDYGDSLSGWYALLLAWLPLKNKTRIPSLAEIQTRLAYVSCVRQLEDLKNMQGCIYLRPPVTQYGTLEFGKFEEIYNLGYRYGQEVVKEWEHKGLLNQWKSTATRARPRGRRNSI